MSCRFLSIKYDAAWKKCSMQQAREVPREVPDVYWLPLVVALVASGELQDAGFEAVLRSSNLK